MTAIEKTHNDVSRIQLAAAREIDGGADRDAGRRAKATERPLPALRIGG